MNRHPTHHLAHNYITHRHTQKHYAQSLQNLQKLHKDVAKYLNAASPLISDLAKRVYVAQIKLKDYMLSLSKYEDVSLIEGKYEKMHNIDDGVLYQLIANVANVSQNNNHKDAQVEDPSSHFSNDLQLGFDELQRKQLNYVKQEYIDSFSYEPSMNSGYRQPVSPISKQQSLKFPNKEPTKRRTHNNQHSKKSNKPSKPIDLGLGQTLTGQIRKKSKGYEVVPQSKLEMEGNMLVLPETGGRRIAISLQEDQKEQVQKRQQQNEKQERRMRVKQQSGVVAQFVHSYLVHKLKYSQDHRRSYIPKKFILQLYLNWSKQMKRKVLFAEELSMVQMFLTNELKVAFNRIDVYSNNYKGLYLTTELNFKNPEPNPPQDIQEEDEMEINDSLLTKSMLK